MPEEPEKTDADWRRLLTPEQYHILRQKGTEPAFTGEYWDQKIAGLYRCAGCGQPLFSSDAKYNSGTGWPSFDRAVDTSAIGEHLDTSHGMTRTEAVCGRCGGHLGHIFPDGPATTGRRYCINSAALKFEPSEG